MEFIIENWALIVAAMAAGSVATVAVINFAKLPSSQQITQAKEWLLYAVINAEQALGTGTGEVKLRYVYDMFVVRFPWLVAVVSFEEFTAWTSEALQKMQELIESNEDVGSLVVGE